MEEKSNPWSVDTSNYDVNSQVIIRISHSSDNIELEYYNTETLVYSQDGIEVKECHCYVCCKFGSDNRSYDLEYVDGGLRDITNSGYWLYVHLFEFNSGATPVKTHKSSSKISEPIKNNP